MSVVIENDGDAVELLLEHPIVMQSVTIGQRREAYRLATMVILLVPRHEPHAALGVNTPREFIPMRSARGKRRTSLIPSSFRRPAEPAT
jgi:hypothetical protein